MNFPDDGTQNRTVKGFILLAIAALMLNRCATLWQLRLVEPDDIYAAQHWLIRDLAWVGNSFATATARIYFYLYMPVYAAAAGIESWARFQLVSLGSFAAAVTLPSLVLARAVGLRPVLLFLLFFWALFPVLPHTPPTSFPLVMTYPWIFAAIAGALLQRWIERGQRWVVPLAALTYFGAIFAYESITLLATLYVAVVLVLAARGAGPSGHRRAAQAAMVLGAVLLAYAFVYLAFRAAHPSSYGGTSFGELSLRPILRVILTLGLAPFAALVQPLTLLRRDELAPGAPPLPTSWNTAEILDAVTTADAIVVLFGAAAMIAVLRESPRLRGRALGAALLVVVCAFLGGNVLQALSQQYQNFVTTATVSSWVGTTLVFPWLVFGIVLLVMTLAGVAPARRRGWVAVPLAIPFAAAALLLAGHARISAREFRIASSAWTAVESVARCELFSDWGRGAIEAPSLFGEQFRISLVQRDVWDRWASRAAKRPLHFVEADPAATDSFSLAAGGRPDAPIVLLTTRRQDGSAPLARLFVPSAQRGWVEFERDVGDASFFVDPQRADARCGSGYVVDLGPGVRSESVVLRDAPGRPASRPNLYRPGLVVRLDRDASAIDFGRGWHPREAWGRWQAEPEASFRLRLAEPLQGAARLTVEAQAFLPPERPALPVRVQLGGVEIGSWTITAATRQFEMVVPAALLAGRRDLDFVFLDAVTSPADLGGTDQRRLGVALSRLVLDEVRVDLEGEAR